MVPGSRLQERGDTEESWELPQLLKKHARNQLQACPEEVGTDLLFANLLFAISSRLKLKI